MPPAPRQVHPTGLSVLQALKKTAAGGHVDDVRCFHWGGDLLPTAAIFLFYVCCSEGQRACAHR